MTELQSDVQKLEGYKSTVEGKLSKMAKEAKECSAKVKPLEDELRSAQNKLRVVEEDLKKAESAAIPESKRIQTLRSNNLEECKLECVTNFDSGFNIAIAKILALHPGLDITGIDISWWMCPRRKSKCERRWYNFKRILCFTWLLIVRSLRPKVATQVL